MRCILSLSQCLNLSKRRADAMSRPNLTKLLEDQSAPLARPQPARAVASANAAEATRRAIEPRTIHKPGEVNISAYFPPEVKAALRQVQAKTGKNIKGCLSEALQLLFRKHNVPVTVSEE